MELQTYKSLLDQVKAINVRYDKINELTGENFNVFKILKLESSEVRMHSAFIAELLNPNGSHGQKDAFLKLFVKDFCFKESQIDTNNCKVEIEKHTGFITKDGTEGGRIDIIISDKSHNHIIIENKIYAGDQQNQLLRYHKYSPNAHLIYLTLYGNEPSVESKHELQSNIDYRCCSYTTDIFNWLENCRKEVTVLPIIRESITQYLNLIKQLTNQTINDTMKDELSNTILLNLEASFTIADNLNNALSKLLDKLEGELEEIANELDIETSFNINKEFKKNYTGFWFWKKNWSNVNIGFQFHNYDKNLMYGIQTKHDPVKTPISLNLRDKLSHLNNETVKPNNWWTISYMLDEPYSNWEKFEVWRAIEDGSMKNVIKEKVESLLRLTNGIDL